MIFSFDTQELKEICENKQMAIKYFDSKFTSELESCLAEIQVAKNLGELPPTLWSKLKNIESPCIFASFHIGNDGQQLIFTQNHTQISQNGIDENWNNVSRIKLIKISQLND